MHRDKLNRNRYAASQPIVRPTTGVQPIGAMSSSRVILDELLSSGASGSAAGSGIMGPGTLRWIMLHVSTEDKRDPGHLFAITLGTA